MKLLNVRLLRAASQEVVSVAGLEIERSYAINALLSEGDGIADARLSGYER